MLKERLLPISLFSLAFAIIISAYIIAQGMQNNGQYIESGLWDIASISDNTNNYNDEIPKDNYQLQEAAVYLRMSEDQLLKLLGDENSGMPYIKVGGIYTLNRNALNKWIETAKVEIP